MDFSDTDPAATVVTDNSAYSNDMSISGGSTWAAVGKEMKAPTRILTPDGGPTYGMRDGCVAQAGLTGISVGTDDCIVEILIKHFEADTGEQIKRGTNNPYYLFYGNAAAAHYIMIQKSDTGIYGTIVDGGGGIYAQTFAINGISRNTIHMFLLVRAASGVMYINGHHLRTTAKNAHNIDTTRMWFFDEPFVVGPQVPGIGCLLRIYIGDLSGLSDADLLDTHRQYISYPYETPAPLLPYEAFRFTGRMPDGSQIPPASTVIHNCAPGSAGFGESLAIQGGLTWGDIRSAVHV